MRDQMEKECLYQLSETIRELSKKNQIKQCEEMVRKAMKDYPDAAQPHNLYGVLQVLKGDHIGGMKHFRAAWALDPTYEPSRKNLDQYGSFQMAQKPAFNESDCQEEEKEIQYKVEYNEKGIGHVIRRTHSVA